jgi:hypothetical protein
MRTKCMKCEKPTRSHRIGNFGKFWFCHNCFQLLSEDDILAIRTEQAKQATATLLAWSKNGSWVDEDKLVPKKSMLLEMKK